MIVHLNGWPGVGKFTIGQILANRFPARLIHNHLLHDVAISCTSLEGPERWSLYEIVRSAAYQALVKRPRSEVFVMTNALCVGSERERTAWGHVVDLAIMRDVPLIPVVLSVGIDENVRRLQSENRRSQKLKDGATLRAFVSTDAIQRPDVPELFELDVTRMSAGEAAGAIVNEVERSSRSLAKAGERHRRLK